MLFAFAILEDSGCGKKWTRILGLLSLMSLLCDEMSLKLSDYFPHNRFICGNFVGTNYHVFQHTQVDAIHGQVLSSNGIDKNL